MEAGSGAWLWPFCARFHVSSEQIRTQESPFPPVSFSGDDSIFSQAADVLGRELENAGYFVTINKLEVLRAGHRFSLLAGCGRDDPLVAGRCQDIRLFMNSKK